MEQQRHTQPDRFAQLEEDARAFKDFAYGLHAEAYIDCGIGELPTRDLVLIALTPDLGDLLTMTAVQQAARVTLSIIQVRWRNLARSLPPYAWRSPITN